MMELLLEFASTIVLTLLLFHFVAKLVSSSSSPASFDSELGDGKIGLVRGCDFLVQSRLADSGIENRVAIVEEEEEAPVSQALEEDQNRCADEKIVERVEFGERVRELVDESLDVSEGLGRFVEKLVEQEISGRIVEKEEALVSQALEEDENRCTDEKIVESIEFGEKVREIEDESLDVSENLGSLDEKLVEQEISGENVEEEEEEAPVSQAREEDENRCTDEKIVERLELREKVRETMDEIRGVSEDLGRFLEKLVEQEISGRHVEEEEEAPVRQALEEDETPHTDEKIVEHVEFGDKIVEIVDESLDASENSGRLREKLVEQEISGENGDSSERKCDLFDESPERDNVGAIEECLGDEEEDDWVGIERTELEKLFGSAMAFVESTSNEAMVSVLDNNVKTKLYGLRKIVTQGPCLEPKPMALKVSARAKWNAWQQLREMTPEMAMEQYVSLLSDSVPGWMDDERKGYDKQVSAEAGDERKLELETHH